MKCWFPLYHSSCEICVWDFGDCPGFAKAMAATAVLQKKTFVSVQEEARPDTNVVHLKARCRRGVLFIPARSY